MHTYAWIQVHCAKEKIDTDVKGIASLALLSLWGKWEKGKLYVYKKEAGSITLGVLPTPAALAELATSLGDTCRQK